MTKKVGQDAYVIANAMVHYDVTEQLSLQLNIDNAFDKTYYESSWGTFTYGEPRSAKLRLDYRF